MTRDDEIAHCLGVKSGTTADEAAEWRERYPDDITVGAYIGRHGWNRVRLDGAVSDDDVLGVRPGTTAAEARGPAGWEAFGPQVPSRIRCDGRVQGGTRRRRGVRRGFSRRGTGARAS